MMKITTPLICALLSCMFMGAISGCNSSASEKHHNSDKKITQLVSEISADSIQKDIRKLVSFRTRHTLSDTTSDSTGIGAARRWIYHSFKRYSRASEGRLHISYDGYIERSNPRVNRPTKVVNVVAMLPGTQTKSNGRTYVVSGHYDSRVSDIMNDSSFAPGADDDASGTAAVMEMARVMSKRKFDANIVFIAVAGEEQGLLGSSHYADEAKQQNKNIAAMFTNDIIGSSVKNSDSSVHDNTVRVFAQGVPPGKELSRHDRLLLFTGGENDTPSRELARFIHRIAHKYMDNFNVNMIYRKDRYLRGGDHSPFLSKGYPAVRFTEPHENFKHQHQDVRKEDEMQYGDLLKFVDFDYVRKVAQLNAASIAALADAPAKPEQVKVDISHLDNNTTLFWQANKESDLKGYEIVWRKTHEPYWQSSAFAGDTTRYTIKGVSKDNYIFGVRAVDEQGHKSPAVYPLPARN